MARNLQGAGAGIFDALTDATSVKGAQGAQQAQEVQHKRHLRSERLSFKVTPEVKSYLQTASYETSTATRRVSMTDYVCMLIERDMEQHPEYTTTDEGE